VSLTRFEQKVQKDGPRCWLWTGGKTGAGYGAFKMNSKVVAAHRAAYEFYVGPIPRGLLVRHLCDNPLCVNPEHLATGRDADNVRDRVEAGRTVPRAKLTEDQRGFIRAHPFSERGAIRMAKRFGITYSYAKRLMGGFEKVLREF
jgi:hypothetical protein